MKTTTITAATRKVPANLISERRRPETECGWEIIVGRIDGTRWSERRVAPLYVGAICVGNITRYRDASHYAVFIPQKDHGGDLRVRETHTTTTSSLRHARRFAIEALRSVAQGFYNATRDEATRDEATTVAAEPVEAPVVAATPERIPHRSLASVLGLIEEGVENVYLVGPAGSGKTSLAADLAERLGREFGLLALSGGVTETHLLGRVLPKADGSWGYVPSEFVRIYENGGVFLLDEIDAADPNVLVCVNAALANGFLVDGEGKVRRRHPETIIVAAANTFGTGPDAQYVGRNPLDAATRDRFVLAMTEVDYDSDLEIRIATGILAERYGEDAERAARTLVGTTVRVRKVIEESRMRRVVSTRFVVRAAKAIVAGRGNAEILDRLLAGWSESESAKVRAVVR